MQILVVDIGNTSTSIARYRRGRVSRVHRLKTAQTDPSSLRRVVSETAGSEPVEGVAIASVVPALDEIWRETMEILFSRPVLFVSNRVTLDVPLRYPRPETIGADRLANAVGGVARYGAPLIVADFGTAVTFDIVTRRGYEGGIIAPGLPLVFDYLADRTAKLPHLSFKKVRGPWGRSTEHAMRLGAQWGYPGLVNSILSHLRQHSELKSARLVLTGGHSAIVSRSLNETAILDPTLTLYGTGRIFELNHGRNSA